MTIAYYYIDDRMPYFSNSFFTFFRTKSGYAASKLINTEMFVNIFELY